MKEDPGSPGQVSLDRRSIIPYKWVKENDMTSKEVLEKVKEMLEINTRVNWPSHALAPNQEFQNILDEIKKMEKKGERHE